MELGLISASSIYPCRAQPEKARRTRQGAGAAGARQAGIATLGGSSFLLFGARPRLRLSRRWAKSKADGPTVVEDGTLMGDRPKVRYIWQVPQAAAPEIVLSGRSNAGKSTLLNEILGANGLKKAAPTSVKGGRTRTLNWYPIGFDEPIGWAGNGVRLGAGSGDDETSELTRHGQGCCLVDCFGLGPVDFSLTARRLQTWGPVLQKFISERRAISMVCHLISCEQKGRLSEGDEQLVEIFQRCDAERARCGMMPFRYVVVLTKTDLCKPEQAERFRAQLDRRLREMGQEAYRIVSCTSMTEDGSGIQEVQQLIDEAKREGWEALQDWLSDAFQAPKPPGGGRTTTEQRQIRQRYVQSAKQSAQKPSKGGPGATTVLPPSV